MVLGLRRPDPPRPALVDLFEAWVLPTLLPGPREGQMMKTGDAVWVYPHGSPQDAITATVELMSGNQRSCALTLDTWPTWCRSFNKTTGQALMLLFRYEVGPWIELGGGGHYEIEPNRPEGGPCEARS
jgi:hypothetical protein